MGTPAIYYINIAFAWLLVLMSIWGYIAILRNKQQRWGFWWYFGFAWAFLGTSHILTLCGIASDVWYMLALRIGGYVLMVISVLSLMIRAVNREW